MIKLPFWPPIHKLLVKNQNLIKNLFVISYVFSVLLIILGFYLYQFNLNLFFLIYPLAGNFGTVSLLLFAVSLVPGILQRLKILPLFSASIVLFRRQIGIMMYFMALLHSMFISTIPAIMSNSFGLDSLPKNGLTGVVTLLILFPVWLTSNDFSQKKLGKFWKILQRLTYIAMFTIFIHVALVEFSAAAIIIILLFFESISWFKVC